jgi:hypothetical protein
LHGSGPTVSAELGPLLADWPAMAEDARARRVSEIARRLSSERRAAQSLTPSARRQVPLWLRPAALAIAVLLTGLAGFRLYQLQSAHDVTAVVRKTAAAGELDSKERAARASRVCEATRARVMRGAAIGPSDTEGWVVELWALRGKEKPSPATDPALAEFLTGETPSARGRITWQGAPTLVALEGEDTTVTVTEANVPEASTPLYRGARVVFTGHFVGPYFEDAPRRDYVRLVRSLTDALGADYAALYARCADGDAHQLGSWFRGPTPGGSVTALLYFMGAFGQHPDLRKSLLTPPGAARPDLGYAFQSVSNAAFALKKARVMTMLASEAGMIAGLDGHVSTITFPFRDSNRATRAGHSIARELGIDEVR